MIERFYDRIHYQYLDKNKCVFFRYWVSQNRRQSIILKIFAQNIIKFKPYLESQELDQDLADMLYEHILNEMHNSQDYFMSISDLEFNNPDNSIHKFLYRIFGKRKDEISNEILDTNHPGYKANLSKLMLSLDITDKKKGVNNDK
jgi:hypothetical protein